MERTTRKLKIGKLDAARRQIDAAIEMWFNDGDPVAIHTLVAAAHELVHALYKYRGLHDLLLDSDWISDEYRKAWVAKIREAPNFFKHADRDPDRVLEFDPAKNDLHILFTLVGLHRMGEPMTEIESIYMQRIGFEYPNILKEDRNAKVLTAEAMAEMKASTRQEFLAGALIAYARRKAIAGPI